VDHAFSLKASQQLQRGKKRWKKKIMKAHWSYDYDTSSTVKKDHDKNNQTTQKRLSTMIE
jgi:hypothetical protein